MLDIETPRANWTDPFFTVEEDLCIVRQKCFAPPRWSTDAEFLHAFCSTFGVERSTAQINKRLSNLQLSNPDHGILRMYISTLLQTPVASKHDIVTKETLRPEFAAFVDISSNLQSILQPHLDDTDSGGSLVDDWLHVQVHSKHFPSVLFAKDQHTVERRLTIADEYEAVQRTNRLCSDEINGLYASEATRYVSVLDNARQREVSKTTSFLDQALQNDLAALHAMHAATLKSEIEKIHAKYADRRDSLVVRIENERLRALELYRNSMDLTILQLEHAMAVNTQQVEAVFGSSECLLQACIDYLTEPKRFLQFALRRELTCPLLAEHTILALFQRLSNQDVKDLKDECRKGFAFSDLLMREIHTRLIALTKELEALPNETLRDVMRVAFAASTTSEDKEATTAMTTTTSAAVVKLGLATRAYPQVLTKEVDRRREFSRVKLDASLLTNHLSLTGDDLVVELESARRNASVNSAGSHHHTKPTSGLKKLLLHSANYALYPTVTLFSSHDPTARVRFNFRGNFDFAIPGYDPYGAELLDLIEMAREGASSASPPRRKSGIDFAST
ncbi:hypothetical protein DYB35_005482 [Aphanomyces astaci]|uniref:Uncharacterized protein n=1 Tax=Aphanomyces astaci TaxID=112090 RepID=A0A3R7BLK7_APHAT|nr:hypothetical protein DYB35_005482 [Aphanomyces astaci]